MKSLICACFLLLLCSCDPLNDEEVNAMLLRATPAARASYLRCIERNPSYGYSCVSVLRFHAAGYADDLPNL